MKIKEFNMSDKEVLKEGSNDSALQTAFQGHLKETEEQVKRLEEIANILGIKPGGKKCVGMEGCIKEGAEALSEKGDETVLDLGIIGAGSRVEHYEMAGYLTAISLADQIGETKVVSLLRQSLAEEQGAEEKLRKIAAKLLGSAPRKAAA
jgi:ferritin-like metal-binding protein YciE